MQASTNLDLQGFEVRSHESERWLRFTPALSTLCILTGTAFAQPKILWLFSLISLIGSVSDHHLFDSIYNLIVRPYSKVSLPDNPLPRRFAMMIAGIWASVAGLLFAMDFTITGYIVGGMLAIAGTLVATTHFCLGSWLYRQIEHKTPPKRSLRS